MQNAIAPKMLCVGELAVEIAKSKNEIEDARAPRRFGRHLGLEKERVGPQPDMQGRELARKLFVEGSWQERFPWRCKQHLVDFW